MNEVTFTMTTNKTTIVLFADQIYGVGYMPNFKSTAIFSTSGAAIPVTDSPEEALEKIRAAKALHTNAAFAAVTKE